MKKCLGIVLGAAVWGALLYVQGTPAIDEEIAEDYEGAEAAGMIAEENAAPDDAPDADE